MKCPEDVKIGIGSPADSVTYSFSGLHGTPDDYSELQGDFSGLHGTPDDCSGLQRTSVDFTDFMGLQVSSGTFS